jgi:putative flippase GtrA
LIRRWLVFNSVGVLGFGVQLGVLSALLAWTNWHYALATALAVEAAVLHNFVWHQRCTWRDREVSGTTSVFARLWRFHLLNGAISLIGNVAIVWLLAGKAGVHPLPANAIAVMACSVVNFAGSEVLVFRTATVAVLALLSASPLMAASSTELTAAELTPQTIAAWQKYERAIDDRFNNLTSGTQPFLAHDVFKREGDWRSAAIKGQVVMFQADRPLPGGATIDVPDGKIHHWVGAIFVPNTTVQAVVDRLTRIAGSEAGSYQDVIASKLLSRDGNSLRVYLKIRREAPLVTVTYNTEHQVQFRMLGGPRATNRSVATKIAEIAKAGTAQEYEKRAGDDSGFLWRLNAYWRYEETNGGVLIECESVSLSRGIPMLARPFVGGIVDRIARESLEKTLVSLRTVLGRELTAARAR